MVVAAGGGGGTGAVSEGGGGGGAGGFRESKAATDSYTASPLGSDQVLIQFFQDQLQLDAGGQLESPNSTGLSVFSNNFSGGGGSRTQGSCSNRSTWWFRWWS
jgi:hypothetical protein